MTDRDIDAYGQMPTDIAKKIQKRTVCKPLNAFNRLDSNTCGQVLEVKQIHKWFRRLLATTLL